MYIRATDCMYIRFSEILEIIESILYPWTLLDSHAPLDSQHSLSNLVIILILIIFDS
jgi:hypothetical protein